MIRQDTVWTAAFAVLGVAIVVALGWLLGNLFEQPDVHPGVSYVCVHYGTEGQCMELSPLYGMK